MFLLPQKTLAQNTVLLIGNNVLSYLKKIHIMAFVRISGQNGICVVFFVYFSIRSSILKMDWRQLAYLKEGSTISNIDGGYGVSLKTKICNYCNIKLFLENK